MLIKQDSDMSKLTNQYSTSPMATNTTYRKTEDDKYRYESARGWPDLHDSRSKNRR
jgi:hypothetical protein